MVENTNISRGKNCFKVSTIVFFFFLIVILTSNQILGMEIDNTKSFDLNVGDYGKYEIKDWFGLQKLQDVELKSNTETCFWKYCSAEKEITLYQKGSLVDDVRFYDGNELVNIERYKFYIKIGNKKIPYTPGKELSPGTYTLVLEGEIDSTKTIDWQVMIGGKFWTTDWALWSGGDAPVAYFKFDDDSLTVLRNEVNLSENGSIINMESGDRVTGILGNALDFDGTNDYVNVTNITNLPIGATPFTVSLWANLDSWDTINQNFYHWGTTSTRANNRLMAITDNTGEISLNLFGVTVVHEPGDISGRWIHLAVTYNGTTGIKLYLNGTNVKTQKLTGVLDITETNVWLGTQKSSEFLDGKLDEVGIWNISINASDISLLYNRGKVLPFGSEIGIILNSPADDSFSNLQGRIFNATIISSGGVFELRNATLSIFYNNGTLFNRTSKVISGTTNTTTFNISGFTINKFLWNIESCQNDSTPNNNCNSAPNNFILNWRGFSVVNEDWTNITIEGNTEVFELNVTLNTGLQISSATLVYNNTNNLGSFTNTAGNNYSISKSISVPTVSTQTNVSFYWSILLDSGTETNTTTHNQTINNIGIDDCSTNTVMILNYSLRDEEDRSFLNGTLFNTTIEIDVDISPLGTTNSIINFSNTFTKRNPASVCLSINLSNTRYRMDVTTRYESQDRISEFHHIQNNTLTNLTIPINIDLHDLKTVDSTTFLITFENRDFLPEENALIDITRKYIGDGVFRSVEIGKTDSNGQTLGHFVVSDATYTIIVSKEGTILATFENILAICNDAVIGDCKINLNAFSTSTPLEDFRRKGGITHTGLNFDKDARTITTTFTSTTGETVTVLINATKFDRFGKTQVCSDSLTSSAGSLTCNIPASLGNITIIADLFSDGLLISTEIFTINPDARANWGGSYSTAIFMGILAVDTIALMFISSPIGILIGALLGLILVSILVIINSGSILGTSSALIWFIVAIAIVIYKIVQRKR